MVRAAYLADTCTASRNRDGEWSSDDYDVFEGKQLVGRITLTPQAPEGRPWFGRSRRALRAVKIRATP